MSECSFHPWGGVSQQPDEVPVETRGRQVTVGEPQLREPGVGGEQQRGQILQRDGGGDAVPVTLVLEQVDHKVA